MYFFFYINKSIIPIVTFCHGFFIYANELLNYSVLYKKLLSNMQSIDSLRELNSKLLAEIAELRKGNDEIPELREKLLKFAEVETENAKLWQIIEENAKRDAENAKHKIRIEELEKNSADISAENAKLKAELAKLRYDFDSSNLTRPQQPQHVTNMQNSCSVGEKEISKVTTVPQPDASDPVIDQPINGATSDNTNIKSMEERETDTIRKVLAMRLGRGIGKRNYCMNQLSRTHLL